MYQTNKNHVNGIIRPNSQPLLEMCIIKLLCISKAIGIQMGFSLKVKSISYIQECANLQIDIKLCVIYLKDPINTYMCMYVHI